MSLNCPLPITATAVRVPVRVGHSAAVNVTLARPFTPDEARALWAGAPGLVVVDGPSRARYPTPLPAAGRDEVLGGRGRSGSRAQITPPSSSTR